MPDMRDGTCHRRQKVTIAENPAASIKQAQLPKTAHERIEALRSVGVDVSCLFAMQGANGGDYVASNKNGKLSILDDNDPISITSSKGNRTQPPSVPPLGYGSDVPHALLQGLRRLESGRRDGDDPPSGL